MVYGNYKYKVDGFKDETHSRSRNRPDFKISSYRYRGAYCDKIRDIYCFPKLINDNKTGKPIIHNNKNILASVGTFFQNE